MTTTEEDIMVENLEWAGKDGFSAKISREEVLVVLDLIEMRKRLREEFERQREALKDLQAQRDRERATENWSEGDKVFVAYELLTKANELSTLRKILGG